jgi:hypothetical protein
MKKDFFLLNPLGPNFPSQHISYSSRVAHVAAQCATQLRPNLAQPGP